MKRWAAVLAFPLLLAAAPVALITGAVRDQYGNPIPGAQVSVPGAQAITDTDGTFALETNAAHSVTIICRYCKRTVATVGADGTVVAIVTRYAALTTLAPNVRDLAALPYAHAESDASLRPFTLFNDSVRVLPGPRVSTYGASAFGGLVIDDGIPQYDIAAGTSSWRAFPDFVTQDIAIADQRDAFRYGDMAGGGTFAIGTQTQSGISGLLLAGNEGALRVTQALADGAYTAAASTDEEENRLRADGSVHVPVGDSSSFAATALLAQDRQFPQQGGSINDGAGGLLLHFEANRPQHFFANAILDREGYATKTTSGASVDGLWTDVMTQAGVSSNTPVQLFATISGRWSTAYYNASSAGIPRVSGAVTQAQAMIGAQRAGDRYAFQGGLGVFSVSYTGGVLGVSQPLFATILSPSLSGSYAFDSHWSASLSASSAFRLPSLLEAYGRALPGNALPFDRYNSLLESMDYTDGSRVRLSLIAMNESVSNLDEGMVHSAGAQLTWQVAPVISLRAWAMHVNDTTQTEYPLFRFARAPVPSTVGSAWLTYDLPGGVRADAIYRRDLIDYQPNPHFDASISGPLSHTLRWFALTEQRHGERYTGAGLQFGLP